MCPRAERPSRAEVTAGPVGDELKIAVLSATNSLLINTTREKHDQIQTIIGYIDVPLQDTRILKTYPIEYADAEEVVRKLQELGFVDSRRGSGNSTGKISRSEPASSHPAGEDANGAVSTENLQVVVLEATNSLLVYAAAAMHDRTASGHSLCRRRGPSREGPL